MTIIDVGAVGFFNSPGYKVDYGRDTVYLFEPLPDFYEGLEPHVQERDNITLYNLALSNYRGHSTFYKTKKRTCSSLYKPNSEVLSNRQDITTYKEIQVNVDTLDNVLGHLPKVGLLKIDTQGTEYEVLLGAEKLLKVTDRIIVEVEFEQWYEGQKLAHEVEALLNSKGFKKVQEIKASSSHSDYIFKKVG